MRRITAAMLLLLGLLVAAPAAAQEASDHPAARNDFVVAPHVGVLSPHLFSDLGLWPIFGLELGYILPVDLGVERPIQISFDTMYTQPGAEGEGEDINLGGDAEPGSYQWELTQRSLILELTGLYRFIPPGEFVSPYGLIGPRLYLMESVLEASGNGGNDFGENRETKTEVGLVVGGGVDIALGPGTLYGALEFGWSNLDERITGDSNTGGLVLDVGYRFYLF